MYKCRICGKEFEKRYAYIGHCSVHNRNESYKLNRKKLGSEENNKNNIKIKKCKYCNKEFESGLQLGGHQTWCKLNENADDLKMKIKKISSGRKLTEEHKDKISKARKKYLDENPGKIPYLLNHSSNESYPEKIFREALEKTLISDWKYNYPVKRYSLDFAFITRKIDVEIDGSTHNLEEIMIKDKLRDETLNFLGWKVIRFSAKEVKEDVGLCINKLLNYLNHGSIA
jgi:very-short-patch-repair endonuclease